MKLILICRTEKERCFIEPSINSVRVSLCIKQVDEMETVLCRNFSRFLMQRAENFAIMRRKPIQVSLLSMIYRLILIGIRYQLFNYIRIARGI